MATPLHELIFTDRANGIRHVKTGKFYPYITDTFSPGTGILPVKPNKRYYIRSITMFLASLVGDAGTSATIQGKFQDDVRDLAKIGKTGSLVDQINQAFEVRVLLDKEAAVDFVAADITTAGAVITYAEVDDLG